jgi:hypothetical protein
MYRPLECGATVPLSIAVPWLTGKPTMDRLIHRVPRIRPALREGRIRA